jgi:hypothetical protein
MVTGEFILILVAVGSAVYFIVLTGTGAIIKSVKDESLR